MSNGSSHWLEKYIKMNRHVPLILYLAGAKNKNSSGTILKNGNREIWTGTDKGVFIYNNRKCNVNPYGPDELSVY